VSNQNIENKNKDAKLPGIKYNNGNVPQENFGFDIERAVYCGVSLKVM
jgi:hypothetical protein